MRHRLLAAISLVVFAAALPAQTVQGRVRNLEGLNWRTVAPGIEQAVLDGNPADTGFFALAFRFKQGAGFPPHWHPLETRVVVVSGELWVGFADVTDTAAARLVKPGGVGIIPGAVHHFEAARTAATIVLEGPGPLKMTLVSPKPAP